MGRRTPRNGRPAEATVALETTTILRLGAAAAFGVAVGLGGYTFVYAKGGSYMTNDHVGCVPAKQSRE